MLSSELEFCLNEAFQRARDRRHEYMTVEHSVARDARYPEGSRDSKGL